MNILLTIFASLTALNVCAVHSRTWSQLIDTSYQWSRRWSADLRSEYLSIRQRRNVSDDCHQSISQMLDSIVRLDDWAIKMINSWGNFPPSGVLVGTNTDFGSYDQCLEIEPNRIIGKPQYCLVDVRPHIPRPKPVHHNFYHPIDVLPIGFSEQKNNFTNVYQNYSEFASFYYWLSVRTGICCPSKCSPQDMRALAEGFAANTGIELHDIQCQTKQSHTTLNLKQLFSIIVFTLVILVSISATLFDREAKILDKSRSLFVDTFSLKRNINCVFNKRQSDTFGCIHGLRVITMFWIILGHTVEWSNYKIFSRAFQSKQIFTLVSSQMILNGFYSVETFFFIGAMLTSYITLQYTNGQLSRFSVVAFLVSKYVRLTPQVVFYMLAIFLLPLGGWASGPIWNETLDPILDNCTTRWWWNILYIQNWLTRFQICGPHTWFLGVDMQLHWFSLVFIIPILYHRKLGSAIVAASVLAFYVTSIIISYSLDLPPGLVNTARDDLTPSPITPFIEHFYYKPWSHITVFLIGLCFGNYLHCRKFARITKMKRYALVSLIITGYVVCLMDTYYWSTGRPYNPLVSGLVFATCRLIWGLSTAALIWLCVSGNGGLINDFLSANIFTPLSRLTYSVYLTHVWVIWVFVGTRRERLDASWTDTMFIFMHNAVIAYIIGFAFTVLIEIPVLKVQKRIKNILFKVAEQAAPEVSNTAETVSLSKKSESDNNNMELQ